MGEKSLQLCLCEGAPEDKVSHSL